MNEPIVAAGTYPRATGRVAAFRVQREPAVRFGSNSQIWLIMATLILKPPKMYSLLLNTAKPPGSMVPPESPGHGSVVTTVITSVTGLYWRTELVAVVAPAAEPPTEKM